MDMEGRRIERNSSKASEGSPDRGDARGDGSAESLESSMSGEEPTIRSVGGEIRRTGFGRAKIVWG